MRKDKASAYSGDCHDFGSASATGLPFRHMPFMEFTLLDCKVHNYEERVCGHIWGIAAARTFFEYWSSGVSYQKLAWNRGSSTDWALVVGFLHRHHAPAVPFWGPSYKTRGGRMPNMYAAYLSDVPVLSTLAFSENGKVWAAVAEDKKSVFGVAGKYGLTPARIFSSSIL